MSVMLGDGRACQNAQMLALHCVGQDETLPIQIELVYMAAGAELHARSWGQRFDEKVHFCIVAKWFEVPDAQNRFLDRLAVEHSSLPEIDIESEALVQGCLEHLKLNCAHDLHLQFL